MNIKELDEKIEHILNEVSSLEDKLTRIDVSREGKKIKKLSQEITHKKRGLELFQTLRNLRKQLRDAKEMEKSSNNSELKELVQEEFSSLQTQIESVEKSIHDLEYNSSEDDINECIIEIRAGTGGEESSLFAADLFRMYTKYADSNGWNVTLLDKSQSDTKGFKEISAQISGKGSFRKLRFENGVHRVQRIPVTESSGRIHTSAVSVVLYPLYEEVDIEINPTDLRIDVFRSGGPGGQSVNTTDSAVRITHIPTETVVSCQDEKSQHKNKKKALSILKSRLLDMKSEEMQEEISDIRKSAIKTGDRSAKIRTYNFPQNRVTDHRIKKSWHNLKAILDGDLDNIVETLESSELK